MGLAGELRERITITLPTVVVDPIGGQTEGTPTVIATDLPASVEGFPLGGGLSMERPQAGQLRGSISKLIRIRFREDITDDMMVTWKAKTFEIGLVDYVGRTETRLYCAEVAPQSVPNQADPGWIDSGWAG